MLLETRYVGDKGAVYRPSMGQLDRLCVVANGLTSARDTLSVCIHRARACVARTHLDASFAVSQLYGMFCELALKYVLYLFGGCRKIGSDDKEGTACSIEPWSAWRPRP